MGILVGSRSVTEAVGERVRAVPGRLVALPFVALGGALATLAAVRRYADLAEERGVAVAARTAAAEVAGTGKVIANRAAHRAGLAGLAGLGGLAARDGHAAPDDNGGAESAPFSDAAVAVGAPGTATPIVDDLEERLEVAAEAEAGAVRAEQRLQERLAPEVRGEEEVAEPGAAPPAAPGGEVTHDDLPLADYDHMTLGSLRGRLRTLSVEDLVLLRSYETAHANRLQIVTMLENRIAKLQRDAAAGA